MTKTTTKMNNRSESTFRKAHLVFLVMFTCLLQLEGLSQEEKFRMGLALEPNLAWMNSRDFEHDTDGLRAHFGYQFMADIMFAPTYAIGTGLQIFRTGSEVNYLEATSDSTLVGIARNFNNQYVELPLTIKMRTREIGYTTYFGKFGGGIGLNTRREADEVRVLRYVREGEVWESVTNPTIPSPEAISGDFVQLFRASMIVGLGFERRLAGNTALMVGLTYNNSLLSVHKDAEVVQVDGLSAPQFEEGLPQTTKMIGHDSLMALSLGVVF